VSEDIHPYCGAWWPPGHFLGYEHSFIHAILDFLTCLAKNRMPEPDFREGQKTQAVLDAVERSVKSRTWERPKA
jgi:predicted dehydrogenase